MRAFLAVCLAGLVLALCSPAGAVTVAPGSISDRTVTWTLQVAYNYWGHAQPACPAGVSVTYFDGVALNDPEVAAYSTQGGCDMHLSRWYWVPLAAQFSDGHTGREELCTVVAHEWGHLLGFGHSTDPQSIMYPNPEFVPPGCKTRKQKAHRADRQRASRQVFYSDRLVTERPHPQLPVTRRHGP